MTQKTNIEIKQGATFWIKLSLHDSEGEFINLENVDVQMQIRAGYQSQKPLITATDIVKADDNLSVVITIPPTLSSPVTAHTAVYDVELHWPDGFVMRALEGAVKFSPEVTRND